MKLRNLIYIIGLLTILVWLNSPFIVSAASSGVRVQQQAGDVESSSPSENGGSGNVVTDNTIPQISDVRITVTSNSALIAWKTNELTISRINWGATRDYSSGIIAGEQYVKNHSALISPLKEKTQNFFLITVIDTNGNSNTYNGEFITLSDKDITPPDNVSQFIANPLTDRIVLSWKNPDDEDLSSVRIVRSDKFFPLDPFNGRVIYEGKGSSFEDFSVSPGIPYFYTIFTRDKNNNYSSGSLSSALIAWYSELPNQDDKSLPVIDLKIPQLPDYPNLPGLPGKHTSLGDFLITFNGKGINFDNGILPVGTGFKITIPKSLLPEDSSILTLSIKDPTFKMSESNFLFSYDESAKEFTLNAPAFDIEQAYNLVVTVFTPSKFIIEKINGSIKVVSAKDVSDEPSQNRESESINPKHVAIPIAVAVTVYVSLAQLFGWNIFRILSIFT